MRKNDETVRRNADKLFQSWRSDWNKFIKEALGVTLDPEQQAIVAAVQRNKRVSVRSGTARGKDFVAACIAVSFCTSRRAGTNGVSLSRTPR